MSTERNNVDNTENENVENSRPNKKNITVTMIFAVLLAFSFMALGIWWFTM
ncbi:hypothetical protein [Nitrosomonas supralitoralis]|uniref:hypothetical protein n=1 Tax=Nitrosomonas supralitoralis TaxID=2116706 RepID=UPI0015584FD2|nr:hypothetical protein [Nitrosomonas supralitoralis]